MVRQNQRIIAEKSQRGRAQQPANIRDHQAPSQTQSMASNSNAAAQLNATDYSGQETQLVNSYPNVNLMDKDSYEARQARQLMGIGMPEARALLKRSGGGSFRQQAEWFAQACAQNG